jgi:hypothetical protein
MPAFATSTAQSASSFETGADYIDELIADVSLFIIELLSGIVLSFIFFALSVLF